MRATAWVVDTGPPNALQLFVVAVPHHLRELVTTGHRQFDDWHHAELAQTVQQLRELAAKDTAQAAAARLHAELFDAQVALRDDNFSVALSGLALARKAAGTLSDTSALAELALAAGYIQTNLDEVEPALFELETAWALIGQARLHSRAARCAQLLGLCFLKLDQFKEGEDWLLQATSHARQHGPALVEFSALLTLATAWRLRGDAAQTRGDTAEATAHWHDSLSILEDLLPQRSTPTLPPYSQPSARLARAEVAQRLGRNAEARVDLTAILCAPAMSAFTDQRAFAQMCLVETLAGEGDWDAARRECDTAIERIEAAHMQMELERTLLRAADIAEAQQDHAAAIRHLRRAIQVRRELAVAETQKRALVMAIKLDTERARAQAAAERERASRLDIANSELRQQAQALTLAAQLDPLTGLANHRRFDAHLAEAHADASLQCLPLCVAMVDVDHFKRINDTHGHKTGDAVLQRLAEQLVAQCRDDDLVARIGGEEFVIVFKDISLARAREACERVRKRVQDTDWQVLVPGLDLKVTVSLGVADISQHGSPAAADMAMYSAKRLGRNRVEVVG